MAGVLDLREVLELVDDRLDKPTFAEQDLVDQVGCQIGSRAIGKEIPRDVGHRPGECSVFSDLEGLASGTRVGTRGRTR